MHIRLIALLIGLTAASASASLADWADPLVGTQSSFEFSAGNTYPAIAVPWGMNFWTPQTGPNGDGWQYTYTSHRIRGFKQTHQPSPWINDYGQFSIMPMAGSPVTDQSRRASWFSHKAETARPYYYSVYLSEYDITTEIAPSERGAVFRFTMPEDSTFVVVDPFDASSEVTIDRESRRIIGYSTRNSGGVPANFRNYFVIEFNRDFDYAEVPDSCAVVGFVTHRGDCIEARVSSSFISPEQALLNLREVAGRPFAEVRDAARDAWDKALRRIEVEGASEADRRTFYTCLYRSLLFPRKFYELDSQGNPIHYSPYSGKVEKGYMYTDTGFWDTFRALFPLLNLLYPSINAEIQQGLLNAYRESGFFPEWASPGHRGCMIGNNSASVIADAFLKGIATDDATTMYEGLIHSCNAVHPEVSSTGRLGHEYYNTIGFVPYGEGINESAARTLEYSYDDWCILQMAEKLGRPQEEIDTLRKRALNYRHLFDPETSLMRGRRKDGSFQQPFSPFKWGDAFTEGNSLHYTWSVFHDPQGLIDLMGGDGKFIDMLDSVFTLPPVYDDSYYGFPIHEIREMEVLDMGNYAHGNQPIQHMIYLYDYAGAPWKTQQRVREVMDRLYNDRPDGYCGDEDNGQTSAWFVFSALGFYPVCPATDQYAVGSPLFPKATLHFENGNSLVIEALGNSRDNIYIHSLHLNGNEIDRNYFTYGELLSGGLMQLQMRATPEFTRGTAPHSRPYSFSTSSAP